MIVNRAQHFNRIRLRLQGRQEPMDASSHGAGVEPRSRDSGSIPHVAASSRQLQYAVVNDRLAFAPMLEPCRRWMLARRHYFIRVKAIGGGSRCSGGAVGLVLIFVARGNE